jgi:hypothetical protein
MNIKDMAFKLFWTLANAALAWATVEVTNADPAWGAIALVVFQLASTFVRQQLGSTPEEA